MGYFSSQTVAEGYAKHRPYFHPLVIEKIKTYFQLEGKVKWAMDVGCGAGLSTIALTALAKQVVGTDESQQMIDSAIQQENVCYSACPAEDLPFQEASFHLITVCGALNWINRLRFFAEAKRILNPKGWVIIYDNFIQGAMKEDSTFEHWYTQAFSERYPKPPRDERPLTAPECRTYGFHFTHHETYTNEVAFSLERCIDYLMTQSNITVRITQGIETCDNIRNWLAMSLHPFFDSSPKTLLFGGDISYLKRN